MLFVVILLVLMALIGTAYIQQARYDRIASVAGVKTSIGVVADATINYIGEVLKNDLLNDAGTVMFDGTTDEPYDYPWTNNDGTTTYLVKYFDGTNYVNGNASGGKLDDTWLASNEPDFTVTPIVWPHITNLNGVFLKLPKLNGSNINIEEEPVNNDSSTLLSEQWRFDTNVATTGSTDFRSMDYSTTDYDTVGVDADGDGILDSKWTWAPIRQVSGVSYVMAVRIIDNSAMINANVALSQVYAKNSYSSELNGEPNGANAPRWIFPSELDFGNFYFSTDASPSYTNLDNFIKYRFNGSTPANTLTPWLTDGAYNTHTRYNFWMDAARKWGNYDASYFRSWSISDELELRYRNGLNNSNATTSIEDSANGMENFLRATATEGTYSAATGSSNVQTYFETEPRHQMTTRSGAAIYATRLPDLTGTTTVTHNGSSLSLNDNPILTRININDINTGTTAGLDTLSNEVRKIIEHDNGTNPFSPSVTATAAAGISNFESYANQFAASFADHFDRDNWVTEYHGRSGTEAWPALVEVYTQRPLDNTSTTMFKLASNSSPPYEWIGRINGNVGGETGYVIEISNPHNRPIPLTAVHLRLNYAGAPTAKSFAAGDTLDAIANTAVTNANHGDHWLWPGQRLLIYHNSTGAPATSDIAADDTILTAVLANTLGTFPTWASGVAKIKGDIVEHSGTYYICYRDVAAADNTVAPNAGTTYAKSHDYWRPYLIFVDGGSWPVVESEWTGTDASVELRPGTQSSNGTVATSWPYQSMTVDCWKTGSSVTNVRYQDEYSDWQPGLPAGTYAVGQKVHNNSGPNSPIYECVNATDAHTEIPSDDAADDQSSWKLVDTENFIYLQSNCIGNVDGLNAFACSPAGTNYVTNSTTTISSVPGSHVTRFLENFSQLAKSTKESPTIPVYTPFTTYLQNSYVINGSKLYICTTGHTSGASFDQYKWSNISDFGPVPHLAANNQLLVFDRVSGATSWTINKPFKVGDIVHELNGLPDSDDRFFICTEAHNASAANQPGAGGSGGNWGGFWKVHWRNDVATPAKNGGDGFRVSNIAELAHVFVAGPNATLELSDILGASGVTQISPFMLDMASTIKVGGGNNDLNHAQAILDRFTIHAPQSDSLDNDGDTVTDNSEELLVPGTINLNTIPTHLLEKILPVSDITASGVKANIAAAISSLRQAPIASTPDWRGMSSPTMLFNQLKTQYSNFDSSGKLYGTVIDFDNPSPELDDHVIGDREEALTPLRWLMGVASARSDIFTAYILIRGYPSNDFTKGPVETKQLIAVFDRSNITASQQTPKILGVYEYK
jgi:hypothetical protein